MAERMFPIQPYSRGVVREDKNKNKGPHPMRVPWSVADQAYSVYAARHGRSQTLERLAERGGFAAEEMDIFLPDWREKSDALAQALERVGSQDLVIEHLVASEAEWVEALHECEEERDRLRDEILKVQIRTVDADAPSALKAIWDMCERARAKKEVKGGT